MTYYGDISRDGLEDMLEEAEERLERQFNEIKRLEKALSEESSRTELFTNCLHRALRLYHEANPKSEEFWPSGDVNIAWLIGGFESARIVAEKAKDLASLHEQSEDGAVWWPEMNCPIYEVRGEQSRDQAVKELLFFLEQWEILYGSKKDIAEEISIPVVPAKYCPRCERKLTISPPDVSNIYDCTTCETLLFESEVDEFPGQTKGKHNQNE